MIEAAGGVLWRKRRESQAEIAVIHRKRYNGDWTLPKGKLQPGELPLQAAYREVCEESGYRPSVVGYLGVIAYQTSDGLKRVRFWNMVAEEQTPQSPDASEVIETIWLPPAEALLKMTYPLEKAILEVAMEDANMDVPCEQEPRAGWWERLRHWFYMEDLAYRELRLLLPVLKKEFDGLCEEINKNQIKISPAWALRVKALLKCARENSVANPELAWRFAKGAQRAVLFGENALNPGAADALADSLRLEAAEKIPNWRGKAIKELLTPLKSLPVWKVVRALKLADEHYDNGFRRLKILRKRLRRFGLASPILITLAIWLFPRADVLAGILSQSSHPSLRILALALMGLIGAAVSVLISTKSVSSDRVPLQDAQSAIVLARLALGPLSALAVVTILASGIIGGKVPDYATALAAAFVSGFSERFVLNSIDAFAKKQERSDQRGTPDAHQK